MSIEQKIEELLAEAEMAGQDPNNAKNNVSTQEIGGAADKVPNVVNQNATEPEEEEGIETDGVLSVTGDEPMKESKNMEDDFPTPFKRAINSFIMDPNTRNHVKHLSDVDIEGLEKSKSFQNMSSRAQESAKKSIQAAKGNGTGLDKHFHAVADELNKPKVLNTEDISVDVSADVAALTEGEELTEQFKEKAAVIFEAAVVTRVKDEVSRIQEQLTEQYETRLNEEVEQIKEGLVEQIDGYLDYVVEQWIEQNEIALDQGLKSEILEGFIGGLKNLFEDHYIEMPEEKYDVLAGLEEEIQQLHSRLDEQVETNIGLKQKITGLQAQAVAGQLAEGMVETDKAKFYSLLEDLEVESVESFEKKAQVIKESYFNKKPAAPQTGTFVSDNPVTLTEEKAQPSIPPQIKSYVSILDNLKK